MKFLILLSFVISIQSIVVASEEQTCPATESIEEIKREISVLEEKLFNLQSVVEINNEPSANDIEKKYKVNCLTKNGRLVDKVFHTENHNENLLSAPFIKGVLKQPSSLSTNFIGLTFLGDIMIVSKRLDINKKTIGYNIKVSYCIETTPEGHIILSSGRYDQTQIMSVTLNDNSDCDDGTISIAKSKALMKSWKGKSNDGKNLYDDKRILTKNYVSPKCSK